MDEVYYESEFPWPTCADATGNTLELITPDLDNSRPESWDCINENGSPNAVNSTGLSIGEVDSNSIDVVSKSCKKYTLYFLFGSVQH